MGDFLNRWAQSNQDHARLLAQETLIVDVTEALAAAIEHAGISRTELAERLNASKGHVSQVLNGSRNMTLRTLADLCLALKLQPRFTLVEASSPAESLSKSTPS